MVESFGDGRRLEEDIPEAPFGLPQIAVMLIPVVEADALEEAVQQIRSAIADAVRAGFNDAMGDLVVVDDPTPEMPVEVQFDMNPTVDSRDQFAYQKYAEKLDRSCPGWWRTPMPDSAAAELHAEAQKRLVREEAARQR